MKEYTNKPIEPPATRLGHLLLIVLAFGCGVVVGSFFPIRSVYIVPKPITINKQWMPELVPAGWTLQTHNDFGNGIYICDKPINEARCETAMTHLKAINGYIEHHYCNAKTVDLYRLRDVPWEKVDTDIYQALAYIYTPKPESGNCSSSVTGTGSVSIDLNGCMALSGEKK